MAGLLGWRSCETQYCRGHGVRAPLSDARSSGSIRADPILWVLIESTAHAQHQQCASSASAGRATSFSRASSTRHSVSVLLCGLCLGTGQYSSCTANDSTNRMTQLHRSLYYLFSPGAVGPVVKNCPDSTPCKRFSARRCCATDNQALPVLFITHPRAVTLPIDGEAPSSSTLKLPAPGFGPGLKPLVQT